MSARRRLHQAKETFQHTVRVAITDLEKNHGFSREHAVQSVLHEIVTWTGAVAPVDEEMVFQVMKQHGLCWEEALRALAVSRAVEQLTKETTCVAAAVEQLAQRLQQAELWKMNTELVSITTAARPRKPVRTGKPPLEHRETMKREKRDVVVEASAMLPIPTEITASIPSEITAPIPSEITTEDAKAKTAKTSLRKRPTDSTSSVSSKPETTTSRKRAAKRTRELDEECSVKRPC